MVNKKTVLKKYLKGIENCKNIKPYFIKFEEKLLIGCSQLN